MKKTELKEVFKIVNIDLDGKYHWLTKDYETYDLAKEHLQNLYEGTYQIQKVFRVIILEESQNIGHTTSSFIPPFVIADNAFLHFNKVDVLRGKCIIEEKGIFFEVFFDRSGYYNCILVTHLDSNSVYYCQEAEDLEDAFEYIKRKSRGEDED
jgi:hypothetical protein